MSDKDRVIRQFSNKLRAASIALASYWGQYPDLDIIAFLNDASKFSNCRERTVSLKYSLKFSENGVYVKYYGSITWDLTVPVFLGLSNKKVRVTIFIPELSDLQNGMQIFFNLENGTMKEALVYLTEIEWVFKQRLSLRKIPEN